MQVFVGISPACWPEEDALYIHTSNPNGTVFPYRFPGVSWGVQPPAFLREFVAGEPWEIGVLEREGKHWFVVRDRGVAPDDLEPDTLRAVIESFVLREGTDYGEHETSLEAKVAQVLILDSQGFGETRNAITASLPHPA